MTPLIALAIVAAAITVWAIARKGLAGLPLILGVWFLYASGLLLYCWFPPTPPQIALVFFLGGISLALIVWGLYNVWLNLCLPKKLRPVRRSLGKDFFLAIQPAGKSDYIVPLQAKPTYGIIYGLVPWDDEGADMLHRFLNEEVWEKGLKLTHFQAEHAEVHHLDVAFILGIVRPKTIIDRILY